MPVDGNCGDMSGCAEMTDGRLDGPCLVVVALDDGAQEQARRLAPCQRQAFFDRETVPIQNDTEGGVEGACQGLVEKKLPEELRHTETNEPSGVKGKAKDVAEKMIATVARVAPFRGVPLRGQCPRPWSPRCSDWGEGGRDGRIWVGRKYSYIRFACACLQREWKLERVEGLKSKSRTAPWAVTKANLESGQRM